MSETVKGIIQSGASRGEYDPWAHVRELEARLETLADSAVAHQVRIEELEAEVKRLRRSLAAKAGVSTLLLEAEATIARVEAVLAKQGHGNAEIREALKPPGGGAADALKPWSACSCGAWHRGEPGGET